MHFLLRRRNAIRINGQEEAEEEVGAPTAFLQYEDDTNILYEDDTQIAYED